MGQGFIITQLLGGLGNQMFQYAAGRRLAHDHGLELKLDASILLDHSPGRHHVNRHFDLDLFDIAPVFASPNERWRYNARGLPRPVRLLRRLLWPLSRRSACIEPSFRYQPDLCQRAEPPAYLAGLWQSWRYFHPIEEVIRRDFTFRQSLPPQSAALTEALGQPGSVCLNVRRGDFVSVPGTAACLGFVGLDYYRAATEFIRSRGGVPARYFVFSDDLDWCRRELVWLGDEATFVEHTHAGPKFGHYLHLMSLANHFIIPNSTFAWWAAWLSQVPSKNVIAPQKWFSDSKIDTDDLCPESWIRL